MKCQPVGEVYFHHYELIYETSWVWSKMLIWWETMIDENSHGHCSHEADSTVRETNNPAHCIIRKHKNFQERNLKAAMIPSDTEMPCSLLIREGSLQKSEPQYEAW